MDSCSVQKRAAGRPLSTVLLSAMLSALLLALLSYMAPPAQAAANPTKVYTSVSQFASTDGSRTDYFEWNRANSRGNLPTDDKWHRMLLMWDTEEGKYYLNGDTQYFEYSSSFRYFRNGPTFQNDSAMTMQSHFYTTGNLKACYIKYVGNDPYYKDYPMYRIQMADSTGQPSGIFVMSDYGAKSYNYPYLYIEKNTDETKATPFTFAIGNTEHVDEGMVKIFYSVPDCIDPVFKVGNDEGQKVLGIGNTPIARPWAMDQMVVYMATEKVVGSLASDYTIKDGETYSIRGNSGENAIFQNGVTYTVEKGGTLVISGPVIFNGKIINKGTVVLNKGAFMWQSFSNWSDIKNKDDVGSIYCEGGNLVVMENAILSVNQYGTLSLKNGSTCQNLGGVLTANGLRLSQSTFYNREGGMLYLGYSLWPPNSDNMPEWIKIMSGNDYFDAPYRSMKEMFWRYVQDSQYGRHSRIDSTRMSNLGNESSSFACWTQIGAGGQIQNQGDLYNFTLVCSIPGKDWLTGYPTNPESDRLGMWMSDRVSYVMMTLLSSVQYYGTWIDAGVYWPKTSQGLPSNWLM